MSTASAFHSFFPSWNTVAGELVACDLGVRTPLGASFGSGNGKPRRVRYIVLSAGAIRRIVGRSVFCCPGDRWNVSVTALGSGWLARAQINVRGRARRTRPCIGTRRIAGGPRKCSQFHKAAVAMSPQHRAPDQHVFG